MTVTIEQDKIQLSSKLPTEIDQLKELFAMNDGVTLSTSNKGHTVASFSIDNPSNYSGDELVERVETVIPPLNQIKSEAFVSDSTTPRGATINAAPQRTLMQRIFSTKDSTPGHRVE